MTRNARSSGNRYNFLVWTRWDWARVLLKFCLLAVFLSMLHTTFSFWFMPKVHEYPGTGGGEYPSAGFKDFIENFPTFLNNYKVALLLHLAMLGSFELLGWVLRMVAFSITFMLLVKIYDVLEHDVVGLGPRQYVNLAMGSLLVGIILLSSGVRALVIVERVYNAISIAILTLVIMGLERIRKSIIRR